MPRRRGPCRAIWREAFGTVSSTSGAPGPAPSSARREKAQGADALAAGASEHTLRAGTGPDAPALSPALQRLAAALEAPLNEDERLLVVWMSRLVPHAEIAGWLGVPPKTAAKRIERLRDRLQLAAFAYLERVGGDERRELLDFLDRAALAPKAAARLEAAHRVGEHP